MPSEFLVKAEAVDKGAIVDVRPIDWQWGAGETLPTFVQVEVTDGLFSSAEGWLVSWIRNIEITLDSSTSTSATLTFSGDLVRESDGLGKISAADLSELISDWGMVVDNDVDNAVTCSLDLFTAATSVGFWKPTEINQIAFTDLGVVNGFQRVEADYSLTPWDANGVAQRVADRGCEIVSNDGTIIRFGVPVSGIRESLVQDVREYREVIKARRYIIAESAVDNAVANGGRIVATETQVNSNIVDLTTI